DGCVGQIAEIFQGDAPHLPCGCFAQAWSVAEVLRVLCSVVIVQDAIAAGVSA
ncbi:MAG TPA: amylo-alpha-1,6-glucosidase, partial [Candidatus Angelobacter sp.]|nr:amylo-alpha-1,6-glucosidase [Candidatus Angelobacter sp.]